MYPRAQINVLNLTLTFFTVFRLVQSRSLAVSPNNEAKNTKGQVWFTGVGVGVGPPQIARTCVRSVHKMADDEVFERRGSPTGTSLSYQEP